MGRKGPACVGHVAVDLEAARPAQRGGHAVDGDLQKIAFDLQGGDQVEQSALGDQTSGNRLAVAFTHRVEWWCVDIGKSYRLARDDERVIVDRVRGTAEVRCLGGRRPCHQGEKKDRRSVHCSSLAGRYRGTRSRPITSLFHLVACRNDAMSGQGHQESSASEREQ